MISPLYACKLARASYWKDKRLKEMLDNDSGVVDYRIVKDDNDVVIVVKKYDDVRPIILIVITGSNDLKDWMIDFNFFPKKVKRFGWIHRGFYKSFSTLTDPVSFAASQMIAEDEPEPSFEFMGHSYGGALAMLMAYDFSLKGRFIESVRTFGSPRVGKGSFQRNYKNEGLADITYNYVMPGDPVTRLPRTYMGWKDVGKVIKLAVLNPRRGFHFLWFGKVYRHYIDTYYRSLNAMTNRFSVYMKNRGS